MIVWGGKPPSKTMKGISDEVFTRFVELCEVLNVGPMATEALGEMLYEVYYEGYDVGTRETTSKNDLKRGIENWAREIGKYPIKGSGANNNQSN